MITSELYPSLPDRAQGFEVSDFIENLDYGTNADHPLRPYTMGYINYENCPDFINLSEVIATFEEGGENFIKIQPITEPANHAWGYCGRKISSQDFNSYSTAPFNIVKDENDIWRAKGLTDNTNYGSICLINSGYLATYSLYNRFILELSISITTDNDLKPNGFTSDGGISTVSEFLDFCNGDRALTFTYNQHEYEINISDFDINGYVVLRDIDDTLTFVVGITNYRFNNRGTGSGSGDFLGIMPWIEMEIDGQTYYVNAEATGGAGVNDVRIYTNWGSSPMTIGSVVGNVYDNKFMFNIKGEISYAQIQTWAKSYDTEMVHYVQELNCFRSYTGWSQATGYQWRLIPIFKPLGIKTLLALRLKRFTGQETTLVPPANQQYTIDVDTNKYNTSDVPTFEIINGEYQDIEGELRPWQMWEVDITENNFDPSDIPPYNPYPPTPSENKPNVWSCNPKENFLISNSFPYTGEVGGDGDFIAAIRSCFKANTARQENGAINVSFNLQLEDVVRKAANEENYIVGILTGKTFNNFDDDFIQATYEDKELPEGDDSILADKKIGTGFYLGENVSYFSQSNPSFSIVAKPQWINVPIGVEYTAQIVRENQKTGEKIKAPISSLRTGTITFTHLKAYDENGELIDYLIYEEIENPSDWDIEITNEEFNYLTDSKIAVIKNKLIGEIPPEPSYDETKIAVIELNENDELTDNIYYRNTIENAIIFATNNSYGWGNKERVGIYVGKNVQENIFPRTTITQNNNIRRVIVKTTAMTEIASGAFFNFSKLKEIELPNTITKLGEYDCFAQTDLRNFIVPPQITELPGYCFYNCLNLQTVQLPNGLLRIGTDDASYGSPFYQSGLRSILIPATVNYIHEMAFKYCANLQTITINKPQDSISGAPWGATNAQIIWTG